MSMVLANQKKAAQLETERTYWNSLTLRLFTNNHTPVESDIESAFTECTDSGYSAVTNVGFTSATLNGSNQGQIVAPSVTFNLNHNAGDYTIYGYYWTDPADSHKLVAAERAASPFTVTAAGQIYVVTPKKVMTTL